MISRSTLAVTTLWAALLVSPQPARCEVPEMVYSQYGLPGKGWAGKLSVELRPETATFRSGSEVGAVRDCRAKSLRFCQSFLDTTFALPKGKLVVGRSWKADGIKFEVTSRVEFCLVGACRDALVIDAFKDERLWRVFIHAECEGLLAFSYYDWEQKLSGDTFFLEGSRGLGAACAGLPL